MDDNVGDASPWYRFTTRADGDLAPQSPDVEQRRQALVPLPWTWLHQVHGAKVVVVDAPGAHAGVQADAAVTTTPGVVLSVTVADCAPVALVGRCGVGVVHVGWRGLAAGVLGTTVKALGLLQAGPLRAVVGPCIGPSCYEFGDDELESLSDLLGPEVRSQTRLGKPALNLAGAVRTALARAGVDRCELLGECTACSSRYWSHRRDAGLCRQALVACLAA